MTGQGHDGTLGRGRRSLWSSPSLHLHNDQANFSFCFLIKQELNTARAYHMALWESSLCNPGICMTTSFSLLNTRPKNHMNLADIRASKNDS